MSAKRRPPRQPHEYPRTARLNELLRQIVAEEIELIEDERIDLATVVAVEADPDLRHAVVHVSSVAGEDGDAAVVEALTDHKHRIQTAIGSQARFKRVPELEFRPDQVTRGAARIEQILRDLDVPDDDEDEGDDPGAGGS